MPRTITAGRFAYSSLYEKSYASSRVTASRLFSTHFDTEMLKEVAVLDQFALSVDKESRLTPVPSKEGLQRSTGSLRGRYKNT